MWYYVWFFTGMPFTLFVFLFNLSQRKTEVTMLHQESPNIKTMHICVDHILPFTSNSVVVYDYLIIYLKNQHDISQPQKVRVSLPQEEPVKVSFRRSTA